MSKTPEVKEHLTGHSWKEMAREALGGELPPQQTEEIAEAVARFAERSESRPRRRRRYGAPCLHVMLDGKRCKQRGWLGGEFCFQHDPEAAELRKLAGRPSKKRLTKGEEVEELLDETMEELRAGRMKPGQAYATGYLAQLMLMARETRHREVKLDVKWYWDMVDLIVTMDDAKKSLKEKERKAREEKKRKKAREAKKQENREPQMNPPAPRLRRAGTDEHGSGGTKGDEEGNGEEEESSEEEAVSYNAGDEVES